MQGGALVRDTPGTAAGCRQRRVRQKAESAEAVVHGHHHEAGARERIQTVQAGATAHPGTTVDIDEHRGLADGQCRGAHIDGETVLFVARFGEVEARYLRAGAPEVRPVQRAVPARGRLRQRPALVAGGAGRIRDATEFADVVTQGTADAAAFGAHDQWARRSLGGQRVRGGCGAKRQQGERCQRAEQTAYVKRGCGVPLGECRHGSTVSSLPASCYGYTQASTVMRGRLPQAACATLAAAGSACGACRIR